MVVFFYGGSWNSGSKDDYGFVGEALASRGIVVVIADYRLDPQVRYPAFLQDGAQAVAWTYQHIADYGADPGLGPPDFHAYVEVYLGRRWYIFDPSGTSIPMGFVRFGTGRDASDVAFATIFGNVVTHAPVVRGMAVVDGCIGAHEPHHCPETLSTCAT
mgnify:CR=1 FL=1